jgi:ElaB/YqjD/DUF883 family membrane-anchored ribosome-binding protein
VDQNRETSSEKSGGGKGPESNGRTTADTKGHNGGVLDQVTDTAVEAYAQAKDAAVDAAHTVQKGAQEAVGAVQKGATDAADVVQERVKEADDYMRRMIEERPYTVALVALGIGWLAGRIGRNDHYL